MISKNINYDLIFFGLGQNCQSYISYFFKEVKKISQKYKTKLIIGENGSTDYTFSVIQEELLSQKQPLDIDFVDTTFVENYTNRVFRLSKARQKLFDYIKENKFTAKYLCVIDLDNVLDKSLIEENLEKMISILEKHKNKYFAVSAKSYPYYYDILNFENEENLNLNILELMENRSILSYYERKRKIYNLQKKISELGDIDSISSFNGMCLYFFNDYIKSNYYRLDSNQKIIPEHLNLNRKIAKNTGKKILISKDIILNMPKEHKPLFNIIIFIAHKIYKNILIFFNKH